MKLYYLPGACSLASHIALVWSGVDYQLERLTRDTLASPAFKAVNPKSTVPTLMIKGEDKRTLVLTESLAVLLFIAEQNPAARLGANGQDRFEVARMNETIAELVSDVHKAFAPAFVPERFAVEEAAYEGARSAAFILIDAAFRRLDGYLEDQDWIVLHRRTVADAYVYALSRWLADTPNPVDAYPNLAHHFARLAADEGVKRAQSEEGIDAGIVQLPPRPTGHQRPIDTCAWRRRTIGQSIRNTNRWVN